MSDYKIICGNNKLTFNETTQSCNVIYNGEFILINSMDILAFDIKEEIVSGFLGIKKKKYKLLVKTHKYDFLNKCDDDREFVFELSNSDVELVNNIQIMIKERINKNIESYKFQKSHKFMEITVSNVLLKNEDGNERQKILRAFSLRHEEIESFNFEEYSNGNCPAVYVLINNKIIGNIPEQQVSEFLTMSKHKIEVTNYKIFGGQGRDANGIKKPYGIRINLRAKIK